MILTYQSLVDYTTVAKNYPPGCSAVGLSDQHQALHLVDTFGLELHITPELGAGFAKASLALAKREVAMEI